MSCWEFLHLYSSVWHWPVLFFSVLSLSGFCGDAGDTGLIPESGRSPGGGIGKLFWYSCLESPMDRGACWVTVHSIERVLHDWATKHTHIAIYTCVCLHIYIVSTRDLFEEMIPVFSENSFCYRNFQSYLKVAKIIQWLFCLYFISPLIIFLFKI